MSVYGEGHDVRSYMFRPTITVMQDTYCGDCYDIYLINSQYTKLAAFGRATCFLVSLLLIKLNIVAVTTILVLRFGNGRSEHVGLDIMFLPLGLQVPSQFGQCTRLYFCSLSLDFY